MKDDVYRVENEPARNEVKDPDPDNVAVFQLLKKSEEAIQGKQLVESERKARHYQCDRLTCNKVRNIRELG